MIIVCGQAAVLGDTDTCVCGFWLHSVIPGGLPGPNGWRYCSPECADAQLEREAVDCATDHLGVRDLLCDCAEVCAPRGLPDAAMRAEYAAYRDAEG